MHKFKEYKEHTSGVLLSESEQTTLPRITHLEDVIFNRGVVGAKQALRVLDSIKERLSGTDLVSREETLSLSENIMKATRLLSSISPLTLNRISTSEKIKSQFKEYTELKRNKLSDTNISNMYMKWIEQSLNSRILQAKRADSKHKRQIEKTEVLRFYRTNSKDIPLIFEFMSLIIEAKNMVVRKLKDVKDDDTLKKVNEGVDVVDNLNNTVIRLVDSSIEKDS
jgi:hypothetical protein